MAENKSQEQIKKRLDEIMPIMQKIAMGDFSQSIPVPDAEDEFTAHFIALNFMIDDLRDIVEENKKQAAQLEVLNKSLEKEVKIRTKDLEAKMLDLERINKVAINRELKMVELKKEIAELKAQCKAGS
jgi:methyl-accepting chemotaxis protein